MDKKDITYVCYVQNYLGILDGEDVVSSIGNEEEGFESYGFVCKPLILEEDYNNGKRN